MKPLDFVGRVLHDSHRVIRLLGKGGMGTVYEASHIRLKESRFAIKVLHPQFAEEAAIYARFKREAEIASSIGHPNIVSVVDFYSLDETYPCMVMEYLEGQDMKARLSGGASLAPDEVVHVCDQISSALTAVHARGIIHRDLKPANIFFIQVPPGAAPQVKVLDFGISKVRDCTTQLTAEQSIMGTPHYMSPEQGEGKIDEIDHRTDIFALATICYQALSGKLPFAADTIPSIIYKICHKQPIPITELAPDLPPGVHAVLSRAHAKDKARRHDTVDAFAHELKEALRGTKISLAHRAEGAAPVTGIRVTRVANPGTSNLRGKELLRSVFNETQGEGATREDVDPGERPGSLDAGVPVAAPVDAPPAVAPAETVVASVSQVIEGPPGSRVLGRSALAPGNAAPGASAMAGPGDGFIDTTLGGAASVVEFRPAPGAAASLWRRRRGMVIGAAGGVLAMGVAAMLLFFAGNHGPDQATSAASRAPQPPDERSSGALPAAPSRVQRRTLDPAPPPGPTGNPGSEDATIQVRVRLLGLVNGARCTVDGREVKEGTVHLPPSKTPCLIVCEADGYQPFRAYVVPENAMDIPVPMQLSPAPPAAPAANPAESKKKRRPPRRRRPARVEDDSELF